MLLHLTLAMMCVLLLLLVVDRQELEHYIVRIDYLKVKNDLVALLCGHRQTVAVPPGEFGHTCRTE